jgi:allantoinase
MKRLSTEVPGPEAGRFDEAWGGIPSLSIALAVVWTEAQRRGCSLTDMARWLSLAPAQLAGLACDVGSIEAGKHANLVAFDADSLFMVQAEGLHYRHAISPYMGATLRGMVRSTWLRGERVWNGKDFSAKIRGREHALSCQPR